MTILLRWAMSSSTEYNDRVEYRISWHQGTEHECIHEWRCMFAPHARAPREKNPLTSSCWPELLEVHTGRRWRQPGGCRRRFCEPLSAWPRVDNWTLFSPFLWLSVSTNKQYKLNNSCLSAYPFLFVTIRHTSPLKGHATCVLLFFIHAIQPTWKEISVTWSAKYCQ